MKKIPYILFIVLIGLLIIPVVFAKDSVEITSITLDNKADNATINSEPTFSGLEMNYDVSFKAKDDYVKYKVIIKNNTSTNYKISNDTSFNDSEFITYKYDVNDELKANGEVVVFVTITYNKEVDSSQLVDGKYTEANRAVVQLLNENNEFVNPDTVHNILLIVLLLILIIGIITILVLNKKKKLSNSVALFIVLGFGVIPTMVFAVETLKLTINVNVNVEKGYPVDYLVLSEAFYTDEELSKYQKTPNSECTIYYVGNVKYNCCNRVIVKDNKLYAAGENTNLNEISLTYYEVRRYDYSAGRYINYCELQGDGSYQCDPAVVQKSDYTIYEWTYNSDESDLGYSNNPNDKDIMNFVNINNDNWQTNGLINIEAPQTFTMPSHDLLFVQTQQK